VRVLVPFPIRAAGPPVTAESVRAAMTEARAMAAVQLESFAANTLEFLRREHELLTDSIAAPEMETDMADRPVLVVDRGYHYREGIASLRPCIREYKPVIMAVDGGGADALLGRPGISSTFITHLRVAGKLVNARGVHQLYHSRVSGWWLLVLELAAAVTVLVAVLFSAAEPIMARYFGTIWYSITN
jgi:uncharacterized membrane-anchored protein